MHQSNRNKKWFNNNVCYCIFVHCKVVFCIKNIPKKTTSEALERYIEAVCGVSRPRVHYYKRQVAVVESDTELQGNGLIVMYYVHIRYV